MRLDNATMILELPMRACTPGYNLAFAIFRFSKPHGAHPAVSATPLRPIFPSLP